MQTRRFGRTGHLSSVAILGACAFGEATQAETDVVMEQVIAAGVNHIDVAPSYGKAEERLAPWMPRERDRFFLGCKTTERSKAGAAAELRHSLERLRVDYFDLYQLHAVTTFEELDKVTRPGGALEAIIEARQVGLTRCIGITGHGFDIPVIFLEALRRFDFDSVLFPLNFVQYANPIYRKNAEELIRECQAKDVGMMTIKSIARGPWGEATRTHTTWYKAFTDPENIQQAVNFVLSQPVNGVCTACDIQLTPLVIRACQNFTPLSPAEQDALIATAALYEPLFV